jgi:hypothetical protein
MNSCLKLRTGYKNSALKIELFDREETMVNLEVSKEELGLISMLLKKEEVITRIELHHARTFAFKDILKERDKNVLDLQTPSRTCLADTGKDYLNSNFPR